MSADGDDAPDEIDNASRRDVVRALAVGAAVAGAGAAGFFGGQASASHGVTPTGFVGTATDPLKEVHTDRLVFHERSSDPNSPDDGTSWWRGDK